MIADIRTAKTNICNFSFKPVERYAEVGGGGGCGGVDAGRWMRGGGRRHSLPGVMSMTSAYGRVQEKTSVPMHLFQVCEFAMVKGDTSDKWWGVVGQCADEQR